MIQESPYKDLLLEKKEILGVPVTAADMDQLHEGISYLIHSGRQGYVLSGNVHSINLARNIPWLMDFFKKADLVRIDGAGVVLGAKILGYTFPSRLTWADWGWPFAEFVTSKGYTLFLLGGPNYAAEKTAKIFQEKNPSIKIVGTHHGYFEKEGQENCTIIEQINKVSPDILVVGLGMPLQERWIDAHAYKIQAKVIITCGAAFEYLSGRKKRCPAWMGRAGLEWLYRLVQEPGRMFKRYVYGNTTFLLHVLMERLSHSRSNFDSGS